eukprot:gene16651-20356_t
MKKRLQPVIDAHCLTIIRNASVCTVGLAGADSDIAFLDLHATPVILAEQLDWVPAAQLDAEREPLLKAIEVWRSQGEITL